MTRMLTNISMVMVRAKFLNLYLWWWWWWWSRNCSQARNRQSSVRNRNLKEWPHKHNLAVCCYVSSSSSYCCRYHCHHHRHLFTGELVEIVLLPHHHIFALDLNPIVPVRGMLMLLMLSLFKVVEKPIRPCVLMPKANDVSKLVNNDPKLVTILSNWDRLDMVKDKS